MDRNAVNAAYYRRNRERLLAEKSARDARPDNAARRAAYQRSYYRRRHAARPSDAELHARIARAEAQLAALRQLRSQRRTAGRHAASEASWAIYWPLYLAETVELQSFWQDEFGADNSAWVSQFRSQEWQDVERSKWDRWSNSRRTQEIDRLRRRLRRSSTDTGGDPYADAYAALGLSLGASATDIRGAYARLVRELHPDHNGGDRSGEAELLSVLAAYRLLSSTLN